MGEVTKLRKNLNHDFLEKNVLPHLNEALMKLVRELIHDPVK
jgi:hypothetical protein